MQPYYCSLSTYVLTGSHELCLGRWVHNAGACRICQKGVPTTPTGHTAQSTNRTWMEVKENYMNEVPEHDLVPLGRHVSLKAVLVVHVTFLLDHYVSHPELCHFPHFLGYFHIRMLMCLTFGQLWCHTECTATKFSDASYACSFLSGVLTQLRECLTFGCCQLIEPSATYRIVENTPDDPRKRKPDISKAIKLLGWQPKVAV
jgi:hypothetical protein